MKKVTRYLGETAVSTYRINSILLHSLRICASTLNVRLTVDVPGENTGNQNGQHTLRYGYEIIFGYTAGTRVSSVGAATDYGLDGRGSITGRDKDFSLVHSVYTGSENHSTSFPRR
jgi:hypothetical protein